MNYFAHARVATAVGGGDALVLGAMLPDFAHMMGVRISGLEHPRLAEGTALHRRTDAAFHTSPEFRRLLSAGIQDLGSAGLRRGPARGAAHVGLELLLDVALAGDEAGDAGYLGALHAAPDLLGTIGWSDACGASRWPRLHRRLLAAGLPSSESPPIAERVARALASRPRLRLEPGERAPLERWLAATAEPVSRAAPRLLGDTLAGL